MINRSRQVDMSTPWWFKAWFVFCALFGLSFAAFMVWAIYSVVVWITNQ